MSQDYHRSSRRNFKGLGTKDSVSGKSLTKEWVTQDNFPYQQHPITTLYIILYLYISGVWAPDITGAGTPAGQFGASTEGVQADVSARTPLPGAHSATEIS